MGGSKLGHWCRRYFTNNSENGKFKCDFYGTEYAEHATKMGNHLLVSSQPILQIESAYF